MTEIKEIKSLKITPFTKMSALICGILGLITGLFILFGLLILQATGIIPELEHLNVVTGLGLPIIILFPIVAFFMGLATKFFFAMLYNILVPKLGGVKLELENDEVVKIPVISFSLILATIESIWAFIMGLVLAAVISPLFSIFSFMSTSPSISASFANATGASMPTSVGIGATGIIVSTVLIIGLPILIFVYTFIRNALFAIFYNYVASRVSKIKLEFNKISENLHELKKIPVIETALAVAIVYLLIGIITGILYANYADFIVNFVFYFIEVGLIALLYNFLAPKIGMIKLNLE